MDLIGNPFVLGAIVFVLVWVIRKFGWDVTGLGALWLTMFVAIIVAILERLFAVGVPNFLVCELAPEPAGFLRCFLLIVRAIVEEAGVIFAAAEVIYQALRREIAGRSVLGERI